MADMRMPTVEDLDAMTKVVTCSETRYVDLDPANRAKIVSLCIQADIADSLAGIYGDTGDIRDWFKNSKLWEGRLT